MKEITFLVPAHVADLIAETRVQLDGAWDDWAVSAALQCLERNSLEGCLAEFDSLLVDGKRDFDDAMDRRRFMLPLNRALIKAWNAEQAWGEDFKAEEVPA